MDEPHTSKFLTTASFEAFLGTQFQLLSEQGSFEAELIAVTREKTHPGTSQESFSLIFRASPHLQPPQQIYTVKNSVMQQDIFLVPIGPDHRGMQLQAVFN